MQNALKTIGLSDKEIKIYSMLSQEGAMSPAVLSYRLDIPRSSCRYICDKLVERKLVFTYKRGRSVVFKAQSLKKIIFFLQKTVDQNKKKITNMQKAIQEMKNGL